MQSQSNIPVKTFTIGFDESEFDESKFANDVAVHLNTDHYEMQVTSKDALELIPKIPNLYDEPFADSSQIPTFFVSQAAKKEVTVSLSGDAGDELFGGYNRYLWAPKLWKRVAWMPFQTRKALGAIMGKVPINFWDKIGSSYNFIQQKITIPIFIILLMDSTKTWTKPKKYKNLFNVIFSNLSLFNLSY